MGGKFTKSVTVSEIEPSFNTESSFANRACFGAGCYWGTEKFLRYQFHKTYPSAGGKVTFGAVGFMGPEGSKANPTYDEVCSGRTGHVEVYDFEFSGDINTYENLVRFFFQFHDPTTENRQGNDTGTQYASVIYVYDQQQLEIAKKVKAELQALILSRKVSEYSSNTVTTSIRKATTFYPAQKYHQDYLSSNPTGYCNHRLRFRQWPS